MTPQELQRLRKRAKLTQAALAHRLGVTETSVARWERGAREISAATENLIRLTLKEAK
jgi:DNA-binding transcriptional regulator YiaG